MKRFILFVSALIVSLNFLLTSPAKTYAADTGSLKNSSINGGDYRYVQVVIEGVLWILVYEGDTLIYSYPVQGDY